MTKNQYKKALEQRKIFVVGVQFTSNGWTGFKVYWNKKVAIMIPVIVEESPYWSATKGFYKCNAWGIDRTLEVILSIGYELGLEFNDIKQRHEFLSGGR